RPRAERPRKWRRGIMSWVILEVPVCSFAIFPEHPHRVAPLSPLVRPQFFFRLLRPIRGECRLALFSSARFFSPQTHGAASANSVPATRALCLSLACRFLSLRPRDGELPAG